MNAPFSVLQRIGLLLMALLITSSILSLARLAGAQDAQPAPAPTPAPCDPSKTPCWSVERWVLGLRVWNQGQEPELLAGGRGQIEVRYRRLRVAARVDGTATAGQTTGSFDLSTVRDVEAHLAVSWDLLRLPGGISVGPMCAVGGAFTLPREGGSVELLRSYTAVCGLGGAWKGGRIHGGLGPVHPFDRGIGLASTWQIPISDHTANVGWISRGRRTVPDAAGPDGGLVPAHGEASTLIWTGVALRF